MHKELFHLENVLGFSKITFATYALCIVLGTFIAAYYTKRAAKLECNITISNNFVYLLFIAGYIGGKVFLYLENPIFYISNPHEILNTFSSGFVFYGSFIFIILTAIWYFKKNKLPILPILDIVAIATALIQIIGRLGCFFAGCCYGLPTDSSLGIVFPSSFDKTVHPTQLYESFMMCLIFLFLLYYKKHKQFNGQLFLFYLGFYAIGRFILENFRGDNRGQILGGLLSHSQSIALVLLTLSIVIYSKLNKQLIQK